LLHIKCEHGHVGSNGGDLVLWIDHLIFGHSFFGIGVEVNKISMSFLLWAVLSEVSDFSTLETGVIGIAWLMVAGHICMIPLSQMLESSMLESSSLMPGCCPSLT
jgi:hypothetical protein